MTPISSPEIIKAAFQRIARRYRGVTLQSFEAVLCPLLIPIHKFDPTIVKLRGESHYRASFSVLLVEEFSTVLVRGRTGKFVPGNYLKDGKWREIAKGRLIDVDKSKGVAHGEIYTGGSRADLVEALDTMDGSELLEIDQFGAAAKVLSGLAEAELVRIGKVAGYEVHRMPEDMAKHLGSYKNYDFEFEKDGVVRRVEVKSIWGTNTKFARLIHSTTKEYPTSSCKFETQDIFAVSLFLRTGDVRDFAFARSVPRSKEKPYGLPAVPEYPEHVTQNPTLDIGDGSWFATIDEVWGLP